MKEIIFMKITIGFTEEVQLRQIGVGVKGYIAHSSYDENSSWNSIWRDQGAAELHLLNLAIASEVFVDAVKTAA